MNETDIVTDTSAIMQMEKASIDIQIATARRYPRQLSLVKQKMLSFATLDEEIAAGCFYTLPGRKGGDGKPLQGPSVRLAEIALSCYQHLRAGSRIISDDGAFITAQGVVHDLENNVFISVENKRRVTNKEGKRYSDDMVATTCNAACSLALRNAAFRVIPMALIKPVYDAARRLAIGDAKSLVQRRAGSVDHFAKMGVPKEKVCEVLGLRAVEDIQLDHLEKLIGYATAIKDGDATIDSVFYQSPETEERKPTPMAERKSNRHAAPVEVAPEPEATAPTEKPDENPAPNPTTEEKNERAALVESVKTRLKEIGSTMGDLGAKCREANLLHGTTTLRDIPLDALTIIAESIPEILAGTFGQEAAQ